LESLARVLHLAQDMTVPHHVIGLLGAGHETYEKSVESLVEQGGSLVDADRISEHLEKRRCFQLQCSLQELFEAIARYTLGSERKAGRIDKDSHYLPGQISYEKTLDRAHELVNLAIASNIVILKVAWRDWSRQHPLQAQLMMAGGKMESQPQRPVEGLRERLDVLRANPKAERLYAC
jgi:hypothetical protein